MSQMQGTSATDPHVAESSLPTLASPVALGFAAFALPLFIWGAMNAGFFGQSTRYFLIPVALLYGGLAEIAAASWSVRKFDALLATVFGSYGAFWLTYGVVLWMQKAGFLSFGAVNDKNLVAFFFVSWSVFAVYAWFAMMARGNYAASAALLGMAATLILMAIAYYSGRTGWYRVGGWIAMITAGIAWYTSAADAINTTVARMILPTHRAPLGADDWLERHIHHPV